MNIQQYINQISDRTTQQALRGIFQQLTADLNANIAKFNAHTHRVGRHRVFTAGLWAAKATTDPDIKTTADIWVALPSGTMFKLASGNLDVSAVAGYAPTALATGKQRYYLVTLAEADGAVGITEGADHASAAVMPVATAGTIAVGWVKAVNASAGNFTFGTTNTDTAGMTVTYGNLSVADPASHQTSKPATESQTYTPVTPLVLSTPGRIMKRQF